MAPEWLQEVDFGQFGPPATTWPQNGGWGCTRSVRGESGGLVEIKPPFGQQAPEMLKMSFQMVRSSTGFAFNRTTELN